MILEKKTKSGVIVFILLILIVFALLIVNNISHQRILPSNSNINSAPVTNNAYFDKSQVKNYKNKYIAALYIEGQISEENVDYSQKWLLSTIRTLKNDKNNEAIALFINSPGGAVYQADEAYLALQDYKTTGKPIYVYQGPMAASGGYYISCAADQIYANRNTLTGCIGVISGTTFDMSEFLNNLGIKAETIHSGKNKNMMNFNEPFTDEQKDIMQSISDECYKQFVSIVANSRKMTYNQVAALSDGRLYTAKQALENGLIDRIDSWENMIEHLSEKIEKPGIKVKTFKKERKTNFFDLVTGKTKQLSDMIVAEKIGLPVEIVNQMNEKRIEPKYLFPGY